MRAVRRARRQSARRQRERDVSIGTDLAEARRSAGLTVGQVSQKTRIRETIIRGIERDDYAACGGDFYARGHIRAIARAVGTDPAPLIEEYDETLKTPEEITAAEAFRPALPLWKREQQGDPELDRPGGPPGEREPGGPAGPAGEREPGRPRRPLWRRGTGRQPGTDEEPGPGATSSLITETSPPGEPPEPDTEPQPVVAAPAAESVRLAEPRSAPRQEPAGQLRPADKLPLFTAASGRPLMAGRPRLNWTYVLALALLAAVAGLGYLLVGGSGHGTPAASSGSRYTGSHAAGRGHPGRASTPARTTPAPAANPAQSLSPVSATAFGPAGHPGDDPQSAQLAISGGVWHTDWYATANFGSLQAGTGLLLDMGRTVTITGAQMTLGDAAGADLQLRAGVSPTMANLPPVAAAGNAGGVLQLTLTRPVTCRYVLIWFTKLPPDTSGTFQVSVSNVKLSVVA